MKQPEIVTMCNKQWDQDHRTGMYDNLKNGQKTRPLWMRIRYAQEQADIREEAERQNDLKRVCPDCHIVLPYSKICDFCGTDYNK